MQTENPRQLLTRKEVADLLRVSDRQLDYMAARGELRRIVFGRLVRFDPADVAKFLESQKEGGN